MSGPLYRAGLFCSDYNLYRITRSMNDPSMQADVETEPLLGRQNVTHKKRNRRRGIFAVLLCLMVVVGIVRYLVRLAPSSQIMIDNALQVSHCRVSNVHLDGWRDSGRLLQLTAQVEFWVDYDEWLSDNGTQFSPWQKKFSRFTSEQVVRSGCFKLNNITTYDQNGTLAYVQVKEPVCLNFQNRQITPLELTVLIEPRIRNVLKVIRKLIQHKYEDLHFSSSIDVSLSKHFGKLDLPLGRIHKLKIHWNQLEYMRHISSLLATCLSIVKKLTIQNFTIRDSTDGFSINVAADPLEIPSELKRFEWPHNAMVPYISWEVKVPDCNGECTINLPTLSCFSDRFIVQDPMNLSAFADVKGPLPEKLLSQVCWSDGENAVTPITNLFNRLLNNSELVTMQARGHPVKFPDDSNLLIPFNVLETALEELSFVPITANFTLDYGNLFEKVTIEGLKIKWVSGQRLAVAGRIVGFILLPFYQTNGQHISVDHIKGTTKLYHDGIHFLTVPMRVWTQSSSQILHNEKDETVLKLLLDIRDDEVKIKNSMELTRVFNEILIRGKALVDVSSKLDLLVSTHLGEIVLLGLKGQGSAVVRS